MVSRHSRGHAKHLGFDHINMRGRHTFTLPERVARGNCGRCAIRWPPAMTTAESNFRFRCYRTPDTTADDDALALGVAAVVARQVGGGREAGSGEGRPGGLGGVCEMRSVGWVGWRRWVLQ
jgi:hypothetical protein